MSYGTIKVNTITFTNNGVDQSVTVSGIVASTSGNLTVTGTVSGSTASFANGIFNTFSGGTCTITSGVLAWGTASNPAISFNGDVNTGIYSPNADEIGFTTNGQARFIIDANGQLEASSAGSASSPTYTFANDVDTGLYSPGTNQLALSAGGVERARIDSSGRLLIGTSTGQGNLGIQVRGTSASAGLFIQRDQNASALSGPGSFLGLINFGNQEGYVGAQIRADNDAAWTAGTDHPGRLIFSTTADGGSSPTERVRITSGGNVGIGTTTVRSGLHLYGAGQATANITDSGDRAAFLRLSQSGSSVNAGGGILFASEQGDNANSAGFAAIKGLLTDGSNNTAGQLAFSVRGTSSASTMQEAMRIDGAGRLLIGTSASVSALVESGLQLHSIGANSWLNIGRWSNNSENAGFVFSKSRGLNVGVRTADSAVLPGDSLGAIYFSGDDGSSFVNAVQITAQADGTPGANDMPGRLVFSTTIDGASSPTEALRITNDRVIVYNQAAPVSKSTAATLTIEELKNGIIQYTGNAQTLTLPTGTSSEGGFSGLYSNMTFNWSVINTGSGTCTVAGDTGHTVVGAGAVAAGSSGRFASRRTGANTFVTYRLS